MLESTCTESIVLEIHINRNSILYFGTVYRSPNSTNENNKAVLNFVSKFSMFPGFKILVGDFNCPNMNWDTWCTSSPFELKFLDTLRKNFLTQYVDKPTRARGTDTPHILDLIISAENFLQNLYYESPLGKSDHCVLMFDCKVYTTKQNQTSKRALSKGDYDGLRASLKIDWTNMLQQRNNNVEDMWQLFNKSSATAE